MTRVYQLSNVIYILVMRPSLADHFRHELRRHEEEGRVSVTGAGRLFSKLGPKLMLSLIMRRKIEVSYFKAPFKGKFAEEMLPASTVPMHGLIPYLP